MEQDIEILEERVNALEKEALETVAVLLGEPKILAFHWTLPRLSFHDFDPETKSCRRCRISEFGLITTNLLHSCPPPPP